MLKAGGLPGNQYYFGMKAHIGMYDESSLVRSVLGTVANVADVTHVISCYMVKNT